MRERAVGKMISHQWKECEKEKNTYRIHGLNERGDNYDITAGHDTVSALA